MGRMAGNWESHVKALQLTCRQQSLADQGFCLFQQLMSVGGAIAPRARNALLDAANCVAYTIHPDTSLGSKTQVRF